MTDTGESNYFLLTIKNIYIIYLQQKSYISFNHTHLKEYLQTLYYINILI